MEGKDSREILCPTIDFDLSPELAQSYEALARLLTLEPDPNKIFEALGDDLLDVLKHNSPEALRKLVEMQSELDVGAGFLVVKRTGIESLEPNLAQLACIMLGSVYGRPTRTDQRKSQIA